MHRTLVVGCGSIGERHVRCMLRTGRTSVAVCDSNTALGREVAERHGRLGTYETVDDALADGNWDLAVVATPAHLHVPIATRLAERGIHLLIEKPLAVTLEGVDPLIATVASQKLVAGIAFIHRAHPVLTDFRNALQSGRFGSPLQLTLTAGSDFAAARPAYRSIYYADHSKGGGAIQDALAHLLDIGFWLVGPFDRLACDAAHQKLDGVTVEDTVHVIARQGSVMSSYSLNQYQSPTELTVTVGCSQGTLRYEMHNSRWLWTAGPATEWNVNAFPPVSRDDWFVSQENAMIDALTDRSAPLCTLQEGLHVLHATRSALRESFQQLPPIFT